MSKEAKPFLKWAGGKGQLISQLDDHLPKVLQGQTFTYIEPFVGGGAMLFHMLNTFPNIKHAVINDINPHLVTAYRTIKAQPDELISRLSALERDYFSLPSEDAKKEYVSMPKVSLMFLSDAICILLFAMQTQLLPIVRC